MGTSSDFKCKCGYNAFGRWGFGMNSIYQEQNISFAPALCRDCHKLVNINVNAEPLKCPECIGLNVVLYSDSSLCRVRRKSIIESRLVYTGPAPDQRPENAGDAHTDNVDEGDDEWDFVNSDDDFEVVKHIGGVDTTHYLCPKCNRFMMEKMGLGLFD